METNGASVGSPVPVALVEEESNLRRSLEMVLHSTGRYQVVVQARHGEELLQAMERGTEVRLVVLDARRPERDGCAAVKTVRERWPQLRLLALAQDRTEESVRQCCEQGAHGVLGKDCSARVFVDAMDTLRRGEHYHGEGSCTEPRSRRGGEPPAQLP